MLKNWFSQARDEGKTEGKLEMALKMMHRFNVSAKEAAETASIPLNELKERLRQEEQSK